VRVRLSDWVLAWVGALGLLGTASFIVFVIRPGGFEGGGYWFILFLPGTLAGIFAGDRIYLNRAAFWALTLGLSIVWYFAISYVVIKVCRFAARVSKQ